LAVAAVCPDFNCATPGQRRNSVDDRILHDRLQHQCRDCSIQQLRGDELAHPQAITKAALLNSQVAAHQVQLAPQTRFLQGGLRARGPQDFGEIRDHVLGGTRAG